MNVRRKLSGDRCQCSTCGEYFNSTHAFDRHRTGAYEPLERRCLTATEMEARGMSRNVQGFWITEKRLDLPLRTCKTAAIGTDPLLTQGVGDTLHRTSVVAPPASKREIEQGLLGAHGQSRH